MITNAAFTPLHFFTLEIIKGNAKYKNKLTDKYQLTELREK